MNKILRLIPLTGLPVVFLLGILGRASCLAAVSPAGPPPRTFTDYEEPKLLVGNIYALGSAPQKLLFKSQRTATRHGTTVNVTCEYTYPDGSLAARDSIVYEAGRLLSFATDLFQNGERGSAVIRTDPRNRGKQQICFDYTTGLGSAAKISHASESVEQETLVDDMIPVFIGGHWDQLMKGAPARFRFVVLSRRETIGFKLVKDSETVWHGIAAVRLRMEPTSFIIAQLVDPIFFIVEKDRRHRFLEYQGRTTPLIRTGDKWKDLDASTVFDWE
jgi:hypothetical protein